MLTGLTTGRCGPEQTRVADEIGSTRAQGPAELAVLLSQRSAEKEQVAERGAEEGEALAGE